MDEPLKGLRKTMEKTAFKHLQFTPDHNREVHERIERLLHSEQELTISALHFLSQKLTGYELAQLLHARGAKGILKNEGRLYALLHKLELDGAIASHWGEDGEKYYKITDKGMKMLKKEERASAGNEFSLKGLLEG